MNMKRNGKVGGRMILDVRINGNCYIFALLCGAIYILIKLASLFRIEK